MDEDVMCMFTYVLLLFSCPLYLTLCDPMDCSTPGLPVPHHLLKFAQAHVHSIADIIQPSHPLMPSSPSALSLSQYQRPSNESAVFIRRPKYGSFSFSISPSDEYSLLIFLMIDWFDLLAVQGTFRSLLQHHSWKASILWHSAFFIVQFSNLAWPLTHNGISLSYKKWNLAIFNSMGGPGRYCFNWNKSHREREIYAFTYTGNHKIH